jgi:hypothetical protein
LADSGWIAVAGVVVGGSLTGAIALFQARSQQRFDTFKIQQDRKWNEQVTAKEREHIEMTKRREELVQIYTRYQLPADRLENAIRELAEARRSGTFDEAAERTGAALAEDKSLEAERFWKERIRKLRDTKIEAFEAAQDEYDEVCELIKLVVPLKTAKAALQQRQLFNRFVIEALNDTYDHEANYKTIVEAADPVLSAMRSDLRSPE